MRTQSSVSYSPCSGCPSMYPPNGFKPTDRMEVTLMLCRSGTNLFAGTMAVACFFPLTTAQAGLRGNTGLTNTDVCLAVSGTNLFAGTWWRRLCFHQQRHKLDCVSTGLTSSNVQCPCRQRAKSLCRDMTAGSSFPPTTAQAGLRLTPVLRYLSV